MLMIFRLVVWSLPCIVLELYAMQECGSFIHSFILLLSPIHVSANFYNTLFVFSIPRSHRCGCGRPGSRRKSRAEAALYARAEQSRAEPNYVDCPSFTP